MEVLWLTNMWPDRERPWYGSFVYTQAQSLRALGVELDVVYIAGYRSSWEYARGVATILRKTRHRRYGLVHAHYGHSGVLARTQTRLPVLLSYCGDDLLGSPTPDGSRLTPRSVVLARGFAQLSRMLDATITKSKEMELKLPLGARKRNQVIPNGVDLSEFQPVPRTLARRQLGWNGRNKGLLFVGNPAFPRKNIRLAEQVRDELQDRGHAVELRVAWELEPGLMPVWMAASDVLLFPSLFEGSPNTVKEAMAMELPIVSAPVGDVPERLSNVPGTFVVPRLVGPMSDAVEVALEFDRAPAARMAVSDLSIERVAAKLSNLYSRIASKAD